jgi:hypothetical protein
MRSGLTGTLVKLVGTVVLAATLVPAAPGRGNLASASLPSITLPPQVQLRDVVCNPAWGTIVLPICV